MQEGKIHQRIVARHQQLRKKQLVANTMNILVDTNREMKKTVADIYQHVLEDQNMLEDSEEELN